MSKIEETGNTHFQKHSQIKSVFIGSVVGTIIEWYDFMLFGIATALVFNKLFFPQEDPLTGTLAAFATYFVGFAVRPLGGIFFGHYGDKFGRKNVLVFTVLLMGIGTTLVGLLPTYDMIGPWAAVLLVIVRIIQGFGAGAEFAGAAVMMVEYAPAKRRGFYGSWSQTGVALGIVAAYSVSAPFASMEPSTLLSWGWRVPFLVNILLVGVALFIRLRVMDTPVFRNLQAENKVSRTPFFDLLKYSRREMLTVLGARFADNAIFYIGLVFVLVYAGQHEKITSTISLTGVLIAAILQAILIPFFGHLSDRIGLRQLYAGACLAGAVFAYPFYLMVDTGSTVMIWTAIAILAGVIYSAMAAAQPAYFSELFDARYRYTGVAAGREIGAIFGGLTPLAAMAILQAYNTAWSESLLLIGMCLVSFLSVMLGSRKVSERPIERINRDSFEKTQMK
jgi:MHS family shikimate/dehydroshikimate transporter-like MFS transporter